MSSGYNTARDNLSLFRQVTVNGFHQVIYKALSVPLLSPDVCQLAAALSLRPASLSSCWTEDRLLDTMETH